MKKENRAVNSLSPTSRKFLAMTAMVATSMSRMVFAAADDLGITGYLDSIRAILMAIGAGLLVLSLGTWAVKAIIKKNVAPEDWKDPGHWNRNCSNGFLPWKNCSFNRHFP